MATSRALVDHFARVGNDISHGLGGSLSKAFAAVDGTAARRELLALQQEWRRAADVEADAAARMIRDQRRLAEATVKYGDDSSRTAAAQAMLARSQRDHIDAMIAAEAAHGRLAKAGNETADSVSRLQKLGANPIFNAAGIGSVAGVGIAMDLTTRKAGDLEQQLMKLHAAAGETGEMIGGQFSGNLKTISDGVLQMSGKVGYTTTELMNAMYTIEKAGFRGADALKVLDAAAQGAGSEQADLMEVVNGLTTSMTDFNVKPEQAARLMSQMVTAVGSAKTSFQDFAGALHSVEPVAAAAHLKLEDVWGTLAQLTQSGTSPEQATENMRNAINAFTGQSQPARDAMAQFGINADEVSQKLSERGLAGTMQYLFDTVQSKLLPGMKLNQGELFKSSQAAADLDEMITQMSPHAAQLATALKNNEITVKDYTKAARDSVAEDRAKLMEFAQLNDKVDGYSKALRTGRDTIETLGKAMRDMTGTVAGQSVALQVSGDHAQETNDRIKAIATTYTEADGTVKGFHESQDTLNAKMRDAHAAFGAAEAEIGSAFVPVMTEVAKDAKWVGDELAKHPGIAHGVITALEGLGGAWLTFKAIDIVGTILRPIASGLGTIIAQEEGAEVATSRLSTALSGLKAAGILGIGAQLGGQWAQDHTDPNSFLHSASVVGTDTATGAALGAAAGSIIPGVGTAIGAGVGAAGGFAVGLYNQLTSHAEGGPLHAPGPKGHDSALFWGADGEHVLTHQEVQKMGGHSEVYKFRSDLMNGRIVLGRAGGGALGYGGMAPDVAVASSLAGTPYSQGARDDCSGMVGRVILGAMGLPATNLPTTKNMGQWLAALGFQPGIGGPGSISVGWYDHGPNPNDGHAAMTLSNGENAEAGGSHGNFVIGAGAAGAASSQFDQHMFLPTLYGEGAATGMPGFAAGMGAGGFGGMGGGIPPGATPGTGPGGQPGYYTANPQRVAAAEERLRHLDAEIDNAEKRRSELKATAKQSERDRLDEEIRHLKAERTQEQQRLAEAERGTFHAMHGRRGAGGGENPFLPVPLADRFGLSKGLPGLAEWTVGFLEDLVLGPLETAAWAAIGQAPPGAGGAGGGFGGLGVPGGLGAARFGFPNPAPLAAPPGAPGADDAAAAGLDTARGNTIGPTPSSGGAGAGAGASGGGAPSAPADLNGPLTADQIAKLPPDQQLRLLRNAFAHPAPPAPAPAPAAPRPQPDADMLPAEVRAWAQQHGMIGPDGNYSGPALPNLGPKSVAPPVKMQPDLSRLGGNTKGPQPPGPPSAPPTPWTESTRGQSWLHDPNAPSWDTGLNLPKLGNQARQFFDLRQPGYFATGGPSGTDTIPAWLSPHEYVEPSEAVDKYGPGFMDAIRQGRIDPTSVRYYAPGGEVTDQPEPPPQQQAPAQQPQNMVKAPGAPGGPAIEPPPGAPKPGDNASIHEPTGPGAVSPGSKQGLSDTATPGADVQQPGTGQGALPGIGFSGGIIGGLEGAATQAAAMGADMGTFGGAGGAVSSAMNIGFQELNRAAAYGAQDVGIGVEGLLEALIPNSDATGADWSKTIPGRLLMGVTGVRPAGQQNTAGQTQQPFASNASSDQYANVGNTQPQAPIQIMGPVHVQANDPKQLHEDINSQMAINNSARAVGTTWGASQAYTG
ncbi:phage tail tape measure protein [Mycobacterium avium]|uniref:phage tail tape measure protein n=1 Tax=Mycobacterium avium TaxID=1764 RepID=UPI00049F72CE|nr:phage tail tape measure protein [Mycobacterium avium]KDP08552.1 phage tail tape measure protein [Mycobacterium avium subsp. hominissuis 101]MCG3242523.1 phage tail tape measure protein [Mycobacterium avium subsp. hominissuis]